MFFSRKKKLLQDRSAGLVFQWRSGNTGNRGGMFLAFVISALFFIVIFASFNVMVKSNAPPPRYTANLTLLGNVNENMTWWIEKNSPYQSRWYDDLNYLGEKSVSEKLDSLIGRQSESPMNWRKMEQVEVLPSIPSVYAKGEVELPRLSRLFDDLRDSSEGAEVAPVLNKSVVALEIRSLEAVGEARLPEVTTFIAHLLNSGEKLGETLSYIVYLSPSGKVINATPLKWTDGEVWKELENWVNVLQFKPSDEGIEILLMEVDVRLVLTDLEGVKP